VTPRPDLYGVLGVSREATQDEINSAYRRLVRRHHPDAKAAGGPAPDSSAALERVLAAYAVLRDPARRAEYDRRHPPPAPVDDFRPAPPDRPARPGEIRTTFTIRVGPVRYHGRPR
jgi:curved DNA-binding protein CbpA